MKILSNSEIETILVKFLQNVKDFNPYMYAYFNTMYLTGARFQDVYNFKNWALINNSTVTLQPQKHNNLRVFNTSQIDAFLLQSLKENYNFSRYVSYSSCLRWYKRLISEPHLKVKNKSITTHLFRHSKAKQLKMLGKSDEQIQKYLGQKRIQSTQSYIYSSVYIP